MQFTKNKIQSQYHFFILVLIFSISFSFLFSSCKKDDEDENPKEQGSYFPLTTTSTWTYQDEENQTYIQTLTSQTKSVGGFTWNMISVEPNNIDEELLVRIDPSTQKVYYGYDFTDDEGVLFVTAIADLDAKIGDTWSDTFEDDGFTLSYQMTLLEKDVTKTINGKSYDNVMVVKQDESFTPLVDGITTDKSTWYFAKGIGIIAIEYEDGDYSRLIDYSIK
ncbi:hypothetical protein V9L05_07705 [Bernardetia sp. Wsw4-3y2]|uniref:hypothetical protein n=1 Tax=Bernardetia sp. Wsw4-3y2 TaxID=3127471 RepID=UPI0030CEA3F3